MILKFKISFASRNEIVDWFGEDLLKVKLQDYDETQNPEVILSEYLEAEFGIRKSSVRIISIQKKIITLELPDAAWELLWAAIKK